MERRLPMSQPYYILAINPGSTSTKIAVYENEKELFHSSLDHTSEELAKCHSQKDQFFMRKEIVLNELKKQNFALEKLSAVVGRGGQLSPLKAGGYYVNEAMKRRIIQGPIIAHASNLGALLAAAVADPLHIPAFIYDAVGSDEMLPVAKITGIAGLKRESFCHVLNTKAMARKAASEKGKTYQDMNFVIAHLGGGISVSAHKQGRIIDVITDDGGPFSPERSGSVPILYIVDMCYSGQYSKAELKKKLRGMGGLKALLGTFDCREIEKRIADGDEEAKLAYDAEAYQIAKGIGEMATTMDGKIDEIILTGGIANSKMLTGMIEEHVKFIAPVHATPGENELESLSLGALRILRGEETAHTYEDPAPAKEDLYV